MTIQAHLRDAVSGLQDLVFPRSCAACEKPVTDQAGALCWDCVSGFKPVTAPFCQRCGDPIEGISVDGFNCSLCRRRPPAFDLARSAFRHRGGLKSAVQHFKYSGRTDLASTLAQFLEACVAAHYGDITFDAVLPVPLHGSRQRDRTYNQSALLAQHLSPRLGLAYRPHKTLYRSRNTPTQTGLNANQRSQNVRDAFRVKDPELIRGATVLLVDDVMTTGATASAAAAGVQAAGASGVYVVTVSRG